MAHRVVINPSQRVFLVQANETVLDAAIRQGIHMPYGCRNGACGKCAGKLISGKMHYAQAIKALTETEQKLGQVLCCQMLPDSDLEIEVRETGQAADVQVKKLPCRVEIMQQLNHDVMYLKLKLPETERMQFLPGQYIDFLLNDDRHRSFSIANPPHDDAFIELHIRHVEGGEFTSEIFENLHVKDMFRIEGPHGNFYLREDSNAPIIFMAGGTGFAPIKSIIESMLLARTERSVHLYWGARAKEDLYQDEVVKTWIRQYPLIRYTPVLSEPKAGDNWTGASGFVHESIIKDYPDLSRYEIYAAGPPAMVYAGKEAFERCGLELDNYISDAFEFNK